MSQSQEIRCLNKEQIQSTMDNMFKLRKLDTQEKIFEGKPSFSKKLMEEHNLEHYTKFADNYIVWKGTRKDGSVEIFVTIETDHFDKQNILAVSGLYHMFSKYVVNKTRPNISLCPAFVVTDSMFNHISKNTIPCTFRFFSLCEVYPMIGSRTRMFKLTYDYELAEYTKPYNNKEYTTINSRDPMVKALNGLPGELLICKRIIYDVTAYSEYQIRLITSTIENPDIIDPSGICYAEE